MEEIKKMKVMTIIGTRPEIIRLSEVIKACDKLGIVMAFTKKRLFHH